MTTSDPIQRFRADLIMRLAQREQTPRPKPIVASPWVAMSMLQKAVRRGRTDLALSAAATLLQDAPDRLWRRLGGIAFEDVGLGCLNSAGLTVAALSAKRFRAAIGGEWAVASLVTQVLSEARKSRASDDLLMALETLPQLEQTRKALACESNPRLRLIALTTDDLNTRALAVLFLVGTDRPGGKLPPRRGEPALAFDLLDELGVAPTTLAICRAGYRKTGEALPPLVAMLALENGLREGVLNDPMPRETMIGPVPNWALDMFTREGKLALARLRATRCGIAEFAKAHVAPAKQLDFLGQVLFRVEGGLMNNRVGGVLTEQLNRQLAFDTLGVDRPADALHLMRDDLPLLNRIRQEVMTEQDHV